MSLQRLEQQRALYEQEKARLQSEMDAILQGHTSPDDRYDDSMCLLVVCFIIKQKEKQSLYLRCMAVFFFEALHSRCTIFYS